MKQPPPWFYPSQFTGQVNSWIETIDRKNENLTILSFTKTDRPRRLDQFLYDKTLKKSFNRRTVFQTFDISFIADLNDIFDIQEQVARSLNLSGVAAKSAQFPQWISLFKRSGIHLVLIVSEAERLLTTNGRNVMASLLQLERRHEDVMSLMFWFEADLMHPELKPYLPPDTGLFQSVMYYPLYEAADTLQLVHYLADRWGVKMNESTEKRIINDCGGHLWLAAQTVRNLAQKKSWSLADEEVLFRVRTIHDALSETEKQVLKHISFSGAAGLTPEQKYSLDYLKKLRVVSKKNTLNIGLLRDYILETESKRFRLTVSEKGIFVDNVPVDRIFSRKELRVAKLLIGKKEKLVTRDEIATVLWQEQADEAYSDWAIDRIIARIRKRLTDLSLPPALIRSVKGKGYILKDHTL